MAPPVFNVVTPCLNIARYIGETIESVVSQAGDFSIRYHIQDGGSSDGTLEIARQWQRRLEAGDFPVRCKGVHLTVESRPDDGMYEAIATGFRGLAPAPHELMTWINGDDCLAPGALCAVARVCHDLPQIQLVGGRHALIDAQGKDCGGGALIAYPRSCIAAGLHDGRHIPFVQQEGTFWRARLWTRVGGIDATFKLAGDFDLWRRFAAVTEYVTLDAVTGFHRRHPDQLSANLTAYYREIDERSAGWALQCHETLRDYRSWHDRTELDSQFSARIARREVQTGEWTLVDSRPPVPLRRVLHPFDGDWVIVSGFDDPEGPFPHLGIDRKVQWIVDQPASLTLFSARSGRRAVSLLMRSMIPGQQVEIRVDGKTVLQSKLQGRFPEMERLSVEHCFTPGSCQLEIHIDQWRRTAEGRQLGVILEAIEFEPPASALGPWLQALDPSRISLWVGRRGAGFARVWRRCVGNRLRLAFGKVAIADVSTPRCLGNRDDAT